MKDILLITPPFTQLNTPYPATAYLKGFLEDKALSTYQIDLGLDVILELFSKQGLTQLFEASLSSSDQLSDNAQRILALKDDYIQTIDASIAFLQGKHSTLAHKICQRIFLPEASRFMQIDDLDWAFGNMGFQDKAKHLVTLYIEDISDYIIECVDENFGFSRYAERLGRSANSFDELYTSLQAPLSIIDQVAINLLDQYIKEHQPKLIGLSIPFPGNLYSGLRCGQYIKANFTDVQIVMGGGFPTTELRDLVDPRVFEFTDYITLDDGELPIELIWKSMDKSLPIKELKRTFVKIDNEVKYINNSELHDYKQDNLPTPDYSDLHLDKYISVIEMANPMHSLWSNGRWNKLTLAHGCYWGRCTFCDGSLDYIKNFDPNYVKGFVDKIENIIAQTGETGFHFVDEAAPPGLMRSLAIELIKRKVNITWWTNIRFEKRFTEDLCILLKESGCIAVSGGLEVASDRLLKLINKGVSVKQVANVTKNFTSSGIMVHSYLMYGFPTQSVQETIDSLEMVRQLFEAGFIQSGFWHQFALTAHSPVGKNPQKFGVTTVPAEISFANNDVEFIDKTGIQHDKFSYGLKKALFNYMHGIGFEFELQEWFDFKIPRTVMAPSYIEDSIEDSNLQLNESSQVIWIGNVPTLTESSKTKRGRTWTNLRFDIHTKTELHSIIFGSDHGKWLAAQLENLSIASEKQITIRELKANFEENFDDFELFWFSKPMQNLRSLGLLVF